jgi:hypothetical protein
LIVDRTVLSWRMRYVHLYIVFKYRQQRPRRQALSRYHVINLMQKIFLL